MTTHRFILAAIIAAFVGFLAGVLVSDTLLLPSPARQATIHPPHGLPWPAPMPPTDKTPAQRVNETFDVLRAHGYRAPRQ